MNRAVKENNIAAKFTIFENAKIKIAPPFNIINLRSSTQGKHNSENYQIVQAAVLFSCLQPNRIVIWCGRVDA